MAQKTLDRRVFTITDNVCWDWCVFWQAGGCCTAMPNKDPLSFLSQVRLESFTSVLGIDMQFVVSVEMGVVLVVAPWGP